MFRGIDYYLNIIANCIYPLTCPICNDVLVPDNTHKAYVCGKCINKISYISGAVCCKCGKPIDNSKQEYCFDCSRKHHLYTQGVGVWTYTAAIKNSIYNFKYHNKKIYGEFYAREMYLNCKTILQNWNADVIIPVPLHKSRQRVRGYNQAEIVAKHLSEYINIPIDKKVLERVMNTAPQKELNDKERVKNLENAFKTITNVVKYKKVILVDDIYTTGTTVDSCTKVLIEAGVEDVYCISMCIGKGF